MSEIPSYAELVTKAEKAVQSIKNPELQRVAFEKVLDDLLSKAHAPARTKAGPPAEPKRKLGSKTVSGGPMAYVSELLADGFFAKPKTLTEVKVELANRGHHIPITSLSGPMQKLCQRRELRRTKAPSKKGRSGYQYANW